MKSKKIKSYKMFSENKDQGVLDFILDKINKRGINSLEKVEKEILDNWHNSNYEIPDSYFEEEEEETPNLNSKEGMVEYIENSVESYKKLNDDSDIILPNLEKGVTYKRYHDQIHIVKYLDKDDVIIVPITKKNNWKLDDSKGYRIPYVELHTMILHKIINHLKKPF